MQSPADHQGVMSEITLNCDVGESFGVYGFGADDELMRHMHIANAACGFHGSDFSHMHQTVRRARECGVQVGAHPSLPDLQGFGRREMAMNRQEAADCIIYQIGALCGFLRAEDLQLSHIKPHGALYGMASREEHIAHAIADAADVFGVPILGLPDTLHEEIYRSRGHRFLAEFFADRDYDADRQLVITRNPASVDPRLAAERTRRAIAEGTLTTIDGTTGPVRVDTVCVHSDTPNAAEVARAVLAVIDEENARKRTVQPSGETS